MSIVVFWPTGTPAAFVLSASANIAASGAATTAQLTAPSGKTSGVDFQAGRIQDDENPADAIDLAAGKYTEIEFSIKAVSGVVVDTEEYEFRLVDAATNLPLDSYGATPTLTIASAGGAVTGTGSVAFAGPALAGSGTETVTGTGAVAFTGPAIACAGAETFTGAAVVAFVGPALAGDGLNVANFGTGAVAFAGPALAGTSAETFTGTGAETLAALVLAASGLETFAGTGAATFAGVAGVGIGAVEAPAEPIHQVVGPLRRVYPWAMPQLTITGHGGVSVRGPALRARGMVATTVGVGTVMVAGPALEARGVVTEIDLAWRLLQAREDESVLLLLGVFDA